MIRRLAIAALGLALVAGPAAALTKTTLTCVKNVRSAFKQCQIQCKSALSTNLPACFGPGAGCASLCQSNPDPANPGQVQCQAPILATLSSDNAACKATQTDAVNTCKAIADQAAQDSCIADAKSTALQCTLAARAKAAPGLADCNTAFNNCLQACASDPGTSN